MTFLAHQGTMVDMSGHEPVFTIQEVAAVFRVSVKTVRRWVDDGKLHCFKTPGGRIRFRESDIRKLLDADVVAEILEQTRKLEDDLRGKHGPQARRPHRL